MVTRMNPQRKNEQYCHRDFVPKDLLIIEARNLPAIIYTETHTDSVAHLKTFNLIKYRLTIDTVGINEGRWC